MKRFCCKSGCCEMYITETVLKVDITRKRYRKKAGVFLCKKAIESKPYQYDNEDSVVLVQSYNNLWGIPKGTFESCDKNDPVNCAIREVFEETGLNLKKEQLDRLYVIKDENFFYYTELSTLDDIPIKNNLPSHDITGVGIFKIKCLKDLIKNKIIKLNYYTILCFKRYFHISFN